MVDVRTVAIAGSVAVVAYLLGNRQAVMRVAEPTAGRGPRAGNRCGGNRCR